jgi:hypothetical protein
MASVAHKQPLFFEGWKVILSQPPGHFIGVVWSTVAIIILKMGKYLCCIYRGKLFCGLRFPFFYGIAIMEFFIVHLHETCPSFPSKQGNCAANCLS